MAKKEDRNQGQNPKPRPPIVVVMGHVDHGKTSLLDYIRKTSVASREAGGITQAVGAYEITHGGRKVTFIDTPGHEAFAKMRSRGAEAADLAILVVAADEGVKPQTKEAIKILEETKTPFVVAINKIDKTGGSVDKARNDLMSNGVLLEGYGGQVSYHGVSAKSGEGVDELLDLILLAADLEDLKYDPHAPASGYILEARREPRRGIEASVIVRNGTLRRSDPIKTTSVSGKVKILENFLGESVSELEPSAPALVIGFEELPNVGEEFAVGELRALPASRLPVKAAALRGAKTGGLNLILMASDAGSLEALSVVLRSTDHKSGDKELNMIDESVGDITDGDVKRAIATGAVIFGFKNKVEKGAQNLAEAHDVIVITSKIVYDLAKAVDEFLSGARGPAAAGELEVLAVFNQAKLEKQLVGGRVSQGIFRAKASFDILRRAGAEEPNEPLGAGRILSLREKKAELTQAEKGKEIGIVLNSPVLVQTGDKLVIRK